MGKSVTSRFPSPLAGRLSKRKAGELIWKVPGLSRANTPTTSISMSRPSVCAQTKTVGYILVILGLILSQTLVRPKDGSRDGDAGHGGCIGRVCEYLPRLLVCPRVCLSARVWTRTTFGLAWRVAPEYGWILHKVCLQKMVGYISVIATWTSQWLKIKPRLLRLHSRPTRLH